MNSIYPNSGTLGNFKEVDPLADDRAGVRTLYPDGTSEILLDVPKYDFNWQITYELAEPKPLPAGTKLLCTAHFDNSENNPANPDPTDTVKFGPQTWHEMMIGWYATLSAEDDGYAASASADRPQAASSKNVD